MTSEFLYQHSSRCSSHYYYSSCGSWWCVHIEILKKFVYCHSNTLPYFKFLLSMFKVLVAKLHTRVQDILVCRLRMYRNINGTSYVGHLLYYCLESYSTYLMPGQLQIRASSASIQSLQLLQYTLGFIMYSRQLMFQLGCSYVTMTCMGFLYNWLTCQEILARPHQLYYQPCQPLAKFV